MSAFVVSKAHVDALIQSGLAPTSLPGSKLYWYHEDEAHHLERSNADEVGAMLWRENVESVGYRYSPSDVLDLPGKYQEETIVEGVAPVLTAEWVEPYTYAPNIHRHFKPVEVLKAISCYEYQSCEHEGWGNSEAKAFCEALRDRKIGELAGYEDASWEIG